MSTETETKEQKPSAKAKVLSARLCAVQALYQTSFNKEPIKAIVRDFLDRRPGMEIDGEKLVEPDPVKFKSILYGVDERILELSEIVNANIRQQEQEKNKELEPLLKAIFLCGAYELLACQDIDSPIIINDYLNVTHAFYEKGEVSLVNGVLDAISKLLRDDAEQ